MAAGIVFGVLTGVVPFLLAKLNTSGPSTGGGLFRTHTNKPQVMPRQIGPLTPTITHHELPPATMPLIDPWANEPAPQPTPRAPDPMPTPPPFSTTPARDGFIPGMGTPRQFRDPGYEPTRLDPNAQRPVEQSQLPTLRDIDALPPPAPVPPASEDETPPQERGELPPELHALPALPSPSVDMPPPGYDPVKARNLAKQVAANITNRKINYSRDLLKQFQRAAGINIDGVYGGQSRGALEFFDVRRPPVALFKPTATEPYRWATWAQN